MCVSPAPSAAALQRGGLLNQTAQRWRTQEPFRYLRRCARAGTARAFSIARGRFMAGAADEDGTRNAKDDAAYDEEEIDPESLEAATSALDELIIDPAFSEARDKELERMMPRHLIGSLMNSVTSLMQLYHIDPDFGEDVSGPLWRSDPEPEPPPNDQWSRGVLNVAPPEPPVLRMPRPGAPPPPLPTLPESATSWPSPGRRRRGSKESPHTSSRSLLQPQALHAGAQPQRPMSAAVTRGGSGGLAPTEAAIAAAGNVTAAGAVRPRLPPPSALVEAAQQQQQQQQAAAAARRQERLKRRWASPISALQSQPARWCALSASTRPQDLQGPPTLRLYSGHCRQRIGVCSGSCPSR